MSPTLPAIYGAATLLVNSTVWIFGGYGQHSTNGLYSLDVSKGWPTSSPSFSDSSSYGKAVTFLYPRYYSSLSLGADKSSLWAYGGFDTVTDLINSDQFAVFNTKTNAWSDPTLNTTYDGIIPPVVNGHSAASDSKGVIYYYGGFINNTDPDSPVPTNRPALMTLDTRSNVLDFVSATSGINGTLAWHTATLVNDTLMYVIGGLIKSPSGSSSDFYSNIYNIATKRWYSPPNSTVRPPGRYGHTAVLSNNGSQIIIFGGTNVSNASLNDVWTLNITTSQWTLRNTTGNAPSGRAFHNSVIVKNQMIVLFGKPQSNNTVYVLDTATWTWTTSFNPSPSNSTGPTSSPSEPPAHVFTNTPISAGGIAGITIAGVIVAGIAIISLVNPRNRIKPRM